MITHDIRYPQTGVLICQSYMPSILFNSLSSTFFRWRRLLNNGGLSASFSGAFCSAGTLLWGFSLAFPQDSSFIQVYLWTKQSKNWFNFYSDYCLSSVKLKWIFVMLVQGNICWYSCFSLSVTLSANLHDNETIWIDLLLSLKISIKVMVFWIINGSF